MLEAIRTKFKCHSVTEYEHGMRLAKLSVVMTDQGENMDFAKATPIGSMEIGIDTGNKNNPFFIPGREYYLEFKKVVK